MRRAERGSARAKGCRMLRARVKKKKKNDARNAVRARKFCVVAVARDAYDLHAAKYHGHCVPAISLFIIYSPAREDAQMSIARWPRRRVITARDYNSRLTREEKFVRSLSLSFSRLLRILSTDVYYFRTERERDRWMVFY